MSHEISVLCGMASSLGMQRCISGCDLFPPKGLKVNDQLVAYATRFLAVRLEYHVWSHHRTLKAKVQFDFSSAYSPAHTNAL